MAQQQRRSLSSPQANRNCSGLSSPSTSGETSPLALADVLNILSAVGLYLCVAPFAALAGLMRLALRLLVVLARGSIQVSQWRWAGMPIPRPGGQCTVILSAPSALILRLVRALFAVTQLLTRKSTHKILTPATTQALEEKIDELAQQVQRCNARLENVEQLAQTSHKHTMQEGAVQPALPSVRDDLQRRSVLANRRHSYPEDYSVSLKRMLAEARARSGAERRQSYASTSSYSDYSPDIESVSSSDGDDSMPPTPTLVLPRRVSAPSKQEKRHSTGLKPLLLPSILAYESVQTQPPTARTMYRASLSARPRASDSEGKTAHAIAEMERDVSICDTPSPRGKAFKASMDSPISGCSKESRDVNGLYFVMADSWLNLMTLPTIPSKRSLSSVEP